MSIKSRRSRSSAPTTFFSPLHVRHSGQLEFLDMKVIPSYEEPRRMGMIVDALAQRGFSPPVLVETQAEQDLTLAHTPQYIRDLAEICSDLASDEAVIAAMLAANGRVNAAQSPRVRFGRYARDSYTSVGRGTFEAAAASVATVQTALRHVVEGSAASAFALSRPPHHHAGFDSCNGYCYLNGTAIAALTARRAGLRAAVLDVDYHHGNGTQEILYETDIIFCSLHGDPRTTFPHYWGYADETGRGAGEEHNLNIPLPHGTAWADYRNGLSHAAKAIAAYGPDILIVSLGVDTYEHDPVGKFLLSSDDFFRLGEAIARLGVPTVFVMEGGYAVDAIGTNVANVLVGFGDI